MYPLRLLIDIDAVQGQVQINLVPGNFVANSDHLLGAVIENHVGLAGGEFAKQLKDILFRAVVAKLLGDGSEGVDDVVSLGTLSGLFDYDLEGRAVKELESLWVHG